MARGGLPGSVKLTMISDALPHPLGGPPASGGRPGTRNSCVLDKAHPLPRLRPASPEVVQKLWARLRSEGNL